MAGACIPAWKMESKGVGCSVYAAREVESQSATARREGPGERCECGNARMSLSPLCWSGQRGLAGCSRKENIYVHHTNSETDSAIPCADALGKRQQHGSKNVALERKPNVMEKYIRASSSILHSLIELNHRYSHRVGKTKIIANIHSDQRLTDATAA